MDKMDLYYEIVDKIDTALAEVNDQIAQAGGISKGCSEMMENLSHSLKSMESVIAMKEAQAQTKERRNTYRYAYDKEDAASEMREMLRQLPTESRRRAERLLEDMQK